MISIFLDNDAVDKVCTHLLVNYRSIGNSDIHSICRKFLRVARSGVEYYTLDVGSILFRLLEIMSAFFIVFCLLHFVDGIQLGEHKLDVGID